MFFFCSVPLNIVWKRFIFFKLLANVVGLTFRYYLVKLNPSLNYVVGDGQSLQWMTYLQPISPQEFLLKIPVQTITVVVTRSAFWTAKTWLCVILDSLMEFVGFSQQVRKFLKVQAKKKLWNQFNELCIKMSFLDTNSDHGNWKVYTVKLIHFIWRVFLA